MQDFRQFLHRLADSGLEVVIVGGYAAVTHGSSLVTRDLDICMALGSQCESSRLPSSLPGPAEIRGSEPNLFLAIGITTEHLSSLTVPAPTLKIGFLFLRSGNDAISFTDAHARSG